MDRINSEQLVFAHTATITDPEYFLSNFGCNLVCIHSNNGLFILIMELHQKQKYSKNTKVLNTVLKDFSLDFLRFYMSSIYLYLFQISSDLK